MQRDDENQSGVGPVAPVVRGKVLPTLSRVVVVALVVGVITFLAGVQLGSGHRSDLPPPSALPASPSASPFVTAFPVAAPSLVTAAPGTSEFVRTFRPPEVIAGLAGGTACVTRSGSVPEFTAAGLSRTLFQVWMTSCSLDTSKRASFLNLLTNAMENKIPTQSWTSFSGERGMTIFYYPYTQGPFVGTVTLPADAAGSGLEIVITIEERLAP
jgi:hypothetical protein